MTPSKQHDALHRALIKVETQWEAHPGTATTEVAFVDGWTAGIAWARRQARAAKRCRCRKAPTL